MTRDEKYLARILFHGMIYKSDGQAFQDLFCSIMEAHDPGFRRVKASGSMGDRKNDGFNKNTGTYYQVYAPEDIQKTTHKAIAKVREDFAGLKAYWDPISPIRKFYFVANDKYRGQSPEVEKELEGIGKTHHLETCEPFSAKALEDTLFGLPDDRILAIVGLIPNPSEISDLDYSVLSEVIKHIMQHEKTLDVAQTLSAPDLTEKISFNGLGSAVSALLKTASYQVGSLEDYFALNSSFARQALRDTLNDMYRSALLKVTESVSADVPAADQAFFNILESATPAHSKQAQDAALVVMAYYFEACDIFEDPTHGGR